MTPSTTRTETAPAKESGETKWLRRWQEGLLPLLSRLIVLLSSFFFAASFVQLAYLHWNMRQPPYVAVNALEMVPASSAQDTAEANLAYARLRVQIALEQDVISRRYQQATVSLMARVWTSYLGFVTGMILALVGAAFVLGKLREPEAQIGVNSPQASMTLRSSSPGILLAGLGVVMMMATVVTHHKIEVVDTAIYMPAHAAPAGSPKQIAAPPLDDPYQKAK